MSNQAKVEQASKTFLLATAIALFPVSFTYGFLPEGTMNLLFGIDTTVEDVNLKNMLRALMSLYLAMVLLWTIGAFRVKYRKVALHTLVFFMFGVAAGRAFSFLLDGIPDWPFVFFFFAEIVMGGVGLRLLNSLEN
ncbi:MAG: DUF4345 domain-containing protein [Saprospiraceae bacterium]|nr:DUF4345 domain-containing protein [Saprospiraceae bacterium]